MRTVAAEMANAACDLVSLQHEFGLYPGKWGGRVLDFVHHRQADRHDVPHAADRAGPVAPASDPNLAARSQGSWS